MFRIHNNIICVFLLCGVGWLFAQNPVYLDLSGRWKFRIDPENEGIAKKWESPGYNDDSWEKIQIPSFWERVEKYAGYDGTAWYRTVIDVPDHFCGNPILLGLGGVDDEFDFWIDGQWVGHFGNKLANDTFYGKKSIHDVTHLLFPGRHSMVFRVVDWQGGGGIHKAPVAIASDSSYFMTTDERLSVLAKEKSDALWPFWLKNEGIAWTVIGLEEAIAEGIVSRDGALGSKDWPFTFSIWLRTDEGKIYAPEANAPDSLHWHLTDGYIPFPILQFGDQKIKIIQKFAVLPDDSIHFPEGVIHIDYGIQSFNRRSFAGRIFLAVRPYRATGRTGALDSVSVSGDYLMVNGTLPVWSSLRKPKSIIEKPVSILNFKESPGDISTYSVLRQKSPNSFSERDSRLKLNAAVVSWPLNIRPGKNIINFKLPLGEISSSKAGYNLLHQAGSEFYKSHWIDRLRNVAISVPDSMVMQAYYASLAYLLINADKGMPHPGPSAYDQCYYRDTAYILSALLRNGFFDFAEQTIGILMRAQRLNGEFPPIFNLNFKQTGYREWDSQGEALYTLAEYARFTDNVTLIHRYWHQIENAVEFLDSLQNAPSDGILPESWAAEDLGSENWHHFWDDFWAIRGLQDAAWMAGKISKPEVAHDYYQKAMKLKKNTFYLIKRLQNSHNIQWIPNGPEDLYGSSMARGSSPAVWPGGIYPDENDLIQRSFDYYWQKWIAPYNGAYYHQGGYWPYAFELGTCYLLLDHPERTQTILRWHLEHQTFPGVYSWGEKLDSSTVKFAAGDMPHGWVAADYINMLRTMLLYEKNDSLIVGAGIPWHWLSEGCRVGIDMAPTYKGQFGFSQTYNRSANLIEWELSENDCKFKTIILKVPKEIQIQSTNVDGQIWKDFNSSEIRINPNADHVVAKIKYCKN